MGYLAAPDVLVDLVRLVALLADLAAVPVDVSVERVVDPGTGVLLDLHVLDGMHHRVAAAKVHANPEQLRRTPRGAIRRRRHGGSTLVGRPGDCAQI